MRVEEVLDKTPEIIQETMSPDVSPESAAGSAVLVNLTASVGALSGVSEYSSLINYF